MMASNEGIPRSQVEVRYLTPFGDVALCARDSHGMLYALGDFKSVASYLSVQRQLGRDGSRYTLKELLYPYHPNLEGSKWYETGALSLNKHDPMTGSIMATGIHDLKDWGLEFVYVIDDGLYNAYQIIDKLANEERSEIVNWLSQPGEF